MSVSVREFGQNAAALVSRPQPVDAIVQAGMHVFWEDVGGARPEVSTAA